MSGRFFYELSLFLLDNDLPKDEKKLYYDILRDSIPEDVDYGEENLFGIVINFEDFKDYIRKNIKDVDFSDEKNDYPGYFAYEINLKIRGFSIKTVCCRDDKIIIPLEFDCNLAEFYKLHNDLIKDYVIYIGDLNKVCGC